MIIGSFKGGVTPNECPLYKGALNVMFNVFFAASGVVFILMGLWLFAGFAKTGVVLPGFPLRVPWVLVILGVSIIVTVLLASLPAELLLYKFFYSSVLFVYAVLELFTGGYLTQYYGSIRSVFKKNLEDHIYNYAHDDEKLMDSIQYQVRINESTVKSVHVGAAFKKKYIPRPGRPRKLYGVSVDCFRLLHWLKKGCEFMIMYCLNLRLTIMAIITILLALLPLFGGFLVLFNAYNNATQYLEIPATDQGLKSRTPSYTGRRPPGNICHGVR